MVLRRSQCVFNVGVVYELFLSLSLCVSPAASEGRVNGGEDFFQKVSVEPPSLCLDLVCVSVQVWICRPNEAALLELV